MTDSLKLKITTAPSGYPVTVDEMKDHLNLVVSETEFDSLIESYISSETENAEKTTGLFFMKQSGYVYADEWSLYFNFYGIAPILSFSSIEYNDTNGNWQTLSSSEYDVDLISPIPRVKIFGTWPTLNDDKMNRIRFNVDLGFSDDEDLDVQRAAIPQRAIQAIKLRVARNFQTREDKGMKADDLTAADRLLFPLKTFFQ